MTNVENLLVVLGEECAEIACVSSKSLRFGLGNWHPEHPEVTNADLVMQEYLQLTAVVEELQRLGQLPVYDDGVVQGIKTMKLSNVALWKAVPKVPITERKE